MLQQAPIYSDAAAIFVSAGGSVGSITTMAGLAGDPAKALNLPTELFGLVALYDHDQRPSALVCGGRELRYHNAAFLQLGLSQTSVSSLLQRLLARVEFGRVSVSVVQDSLTFRGIPIVDGWAAVICTGGVERYAFGGDALLSVAKPGPEARRSGNDMTQLDGPLSDESLLDWTRYEVPGLPKFVRWVRDFDWEATALGPMKSWPMALRAPLVNMMSNPNPRSMIWGAEKNLIYNEACMPLWAARHAQPLGQPAKEAFAHLWETVGDKIEEAFKGKAQVLKDHSIMGRSVAEEGLVEERFFNVAILPLIGSDGRVHGVLNEMSETTPIVRGIRRKALTVKVMEGMASATSTQEVWNSFMSGLEAAPKDVPFALFYEVTDDSSSADSGMDVGECTLRGTVGISMDNNALIQRFSLSNQSSGMITSCQEAWRTAKTVMLSQAEGTLPIELATANPDRAYGDPIQKAIVVPITSPLRREVLGLMVLGVSPRCPFDRDYWLWARLICDQMTKQAALLTLPEEQRQAQRIADELNESLTQQLRITTLQVERSENKFRRMAESAPVGMCMFDVNGRAMHVNDQYLNLIGMTREEFETRECSNGEWKRHLYPDDVERFEQAWTRIVETASPVTIEYRTTRHWRSIDKATGQEIEGDTWLLANAFPEVDADGKVCAVMGWLENVSHRKFTEHLLARQLQDALETKKQTERFIDMTSHEMRNPLSAILQSADMIISALSGGVANPSADGTSPIAPEIVEDLVDAAQTIILCAQHQKRIVDDVLTLSKLDASLLVISPDKVQATSVVERALKMYESEIIHAGIKARLCVEPSYKELDVDWVLLDSSRLLQICINLLTNAIKFTQDSDKREITICLGASNQPPTGKHHNINFIPVREERQHRHRSSQAQGSDADDLYLQIAVADTGRGLSEDEMQVLFQRFSQASPKTYSKYGGNGLGLFISRELCELQGGQIGVASTPEKTTFTFFVKVKRWEPEEDDVAALPTLHRCASASASPIVYERRGSIYLPDNSHPTSRDPGNPKTQVSKEANGVHDQSSQTDDELSDGKIHVLVVEDNIINQRVMSKQLRGAGCTVHVANHGLECLSFLETTKFCASKVPLSIVLLDLEMPTMDGLTCIRHIRDWQQNGKIARHVPVIAVTANARSEQISGALSAGMDRVVTKPFRLPELMPQMSSLIAEVGRRHSG